MRNSLSLLHRSIFAAATIFRKSEIRRNNITLRILAPGANHVVAPGMIIVLIISKVANFADIDAEIGQFFAIFKHRFEIKDAIASAIVEIDVPGCA